MSRALSVVRHPYAKHSTLNAKIFTSPASAGPTGGLVYDDFAVNDDSRAFVVASVVGTAQATEAVVQALGAAVRTSLTGGCTVGSTFAGINRRFESFLATDTFPLCSLYIGLVHPRERQFEYLSSGHLSAMLFDGSVSHQHLEATGPPIGLVMPTRREDARLCSVAERGALVVVTNVICRAAAASREGAEFGTAGIGRAFAAASRLRRDPARAIYAAAARHSCARLAEDAGVFVAEFDSTLL